MQGIKCAFVNVRVRLQTQFCLRTNVITALCLQPDPWLSATCTRGATIPQHDKWVRLCDEHQSVSPAMSTHIAVTDLMRGSAQWFSACLQLMLNVYCEFRVMALSSVDKRGDKGRGTHGQSERKPSETPFSIFGGELTPPFWRLVLMLCT